MPELFSVASVGLEKVAFSSIFLSSGATDLSKTLRQTISFLAIKRAFFNVKSDKSLALELFPI